MPNPTETTTAVYSIERASYHGLDCFVLVNVLKGEIIQWSYDFREINDTYGRIAS